MSVKVVNECRKCPPKLASSLDVYGLKTSSIQRPLLSGLAKLSLIQL